MIWLSQGDTVHFQVLPGFSSTLQLVAFLICLIGFFIHYRLQQ